jgi:hypothetical protein
MLLSSLAHGGPIEDLQPGEWFEAPNSTMAPHMPPSTADDWGGSGSIMGAWSSGAYDTSRDRLVIWGGGHHDYAGNEIYVFDVSTLSWERLTDRSTDVGGDEASGYYPDGLPRSRHTYEYIEYLPPPFDRFCSLGGSALFPSGQIAIPNVDCFDFESLTWERRADAPSYGIGAVAAVDPNTGFAWIQGAGNSQPLAHYEPAGDTWYTHAIEPSGWFAYSHTAAIDSTRRRLVAVGGGESVVWDLDAPDAEPVRLATTGDTEIEQVANPGLDYDAVADRMVAWAGGADLYALDLDTSVWTLHPPAPSNTAVPTEAAANGTYGRFRYVPSKNVFVVVNAIDESVFFGKLSPGGGAGGDGGTGSGGSAGAGASAGASAAGGGGAGTLPAEPNEDAGCGCRVGSSSRVPFGPQLPWLALILAGCLIRRGFRQRDECRALGRGGDGREELFEEA